MEEEVRNKQMNIITLKYLCCLMVFPFLLSCEKKAGWENDSAPPDLIVVDGIITNENISHTIEITKPVKNLNDPHEYVSGASVIVSDGKKHYPFIENPEKKGEYISAPFIAVTNKTYTLHIEYNNKTYQATANAIPATPFTPGNIGQVPEHDSFYYIKGPPSSDEQAMWEYIIHYPDTTKQTQIIDSIHTAKVIYYSLHSFDNVQIFSPEKEKIYFHVNTTIIQKKYSLSDEHAKFIRSLLYETEWRGGFFDVEAANVSSNISEGAVGFFGASTVLVDTIKITHK